VSTVTPIRAIIGFTLREKTYLNHLGFTACQGLLVSQPIGPSEAIRIYCDRATANHRQNWQGSISSVSGPTSIYEPNASLSAFSLQCYVERSAQDTSFIHWIDIDIERSSNNCIMSIED
jgi:hypothetical protein